MSNSFNDILLAHFQATRGAFSEVTNDEFRKKQVTLVGPEQEIAEQLVADIEQRVGAKKEIVDAGLDPQVTVKRWPNGDPIDVTFYYKKKNGIKSNELRLYLNKNFKPNPHVNWCIFERDGELWLGQFLRDAFDLPLETAAVARESRPQLEPEIDDYQEAINSGAPETIQSVLTKWKRNPKFGAQALKSAGYKCEMQPDAPSFNSRFTGKPFMEAHHLVPMKMQSDFKAINLDEVGNICCLGPLAHRKLHFAPIGDIADDLALLHGRKKAFLDKLGLSVDDLIKLYEG